MMARRAGAFVGGAGKLLAGDGFVGLFAAPDASQSQMKKLQSSLGVSWTSRVFDAEALGQVCGRSSLAFAGIRPARGGNMVETLHTELTRLERFTASVACKCG